MPASISIRDSIRWIPDQASEPSRTVVVTSNENRFVDVRILKSTTDTSSEYPKDILPLSRLDWAFAGISQSTLGTGTDSETGSPCIAHATWKHWVDSRHRNAANVSDSGDMFALSDGRTLEKGQMVNPATGVETEYEEIWRDVAPLATTRQHDPSATGEAKAQCVVLLLHDDEREARGMVVKVGQFCQGVLRVGSNVALERWVWAAIGGWKREVRMGEMLVPCGVATSSKVSAKGEKVVFGEYEWKVVEKGMV